MGRAAPAGKNSWGPALLGPSVRPGSANNPAGADLAMACTKMVLVLRREGDLHDGGLVLLRSDHHHGGTLVLGRRNHGRPTHRRAFEIRPTLFLKFGLVERGDFGD